MWPPQTTVWADIMPSKATIQNAAQNATHYRPGLEKPEAGETEAIYSLIDTMHSIQQKTFQDGGHALGSVHAESHALLRGELEVFAGLPPQLAQGLGLRPAEYALVGEP